MAEQLRKQSIEVILLGIKTNAKAVSSKYYPFEESKRKLRHDLFRLRFATGSLEAAERAEKELSLRRSMDELEAEQGRLSLEVNHLNELKDDIDKTAGAVEESITPFG
jgi:hypothetical protein